MRVKSRLVWNLGSAWLWPSAMARMSSSRRGRCSSAGLRRRQWKASTQVMPLRSSCMALRIVPRFQPRWASAQICPPGPRAWTVLAMKARRWLALRVLAVSMSTGIISAAGRMSEAPGTAGRETAGYRIVSFFQAPEELPADLSRSQQALPRPVCGDLPVVVQHQGSDRWLSPSLDGKKVYHHSPHMSRTLFLFQTPKDYGSR